MEMHVRFFPALPMRVMHSIEAHPCAYAVASSAPSLYPPHKQEYNRAELLNETRIAEALRLGQVYAQVHPSISRTCAPFSRTCAPFLLPHVRTLPSARAPFSCTCAPFSGTCFSHLQHVAQDQTVVYVV